MHDAVILFSIQVYLAVTVWIALLDFGGHDKVSYQSRCGISVNFRTTSLVVSIRPFHDQGVASPIVQRTYLLQSRKVLLVKRIQNL